MPIKEAQHGESYRENLCRLQQGLLPQAQRGLDLEVLLEGVSGDWQKGQNVYGANL